MNSILSGANGSGASVKRLASDFSGAVFGAARTDVGGVGAALRTDFGKAAGAPLRSFEAGALGFRQEGANAFAPPLHESEETNPRITVQGRRIMPLRASSLGDADLGPPSERQLCLIWRSSAAEGGERVNASFGGNGGLAGSLPSFASSGLAGTQLFTQAPMPTGADSISFMSLPSLATSPIQNNYFLADLLNAWASADAGAYLKVTAQMLVYGMRKLPPWYDKKTFAKLPGADRYEGWSWDGIPRNTIAEDGTAPQYDDGLSRTSARAAKSYAVAMTSRGPEYCLDYWDGRGLDTGNYLYAILKKSPLEAYLHPSEGSDEERNGRLLYHLATKAHDEYRDGANMRRIISLAKIGVPTAGDGSKKVPIRPFQWHFVSSRTVLSREAARYENEDGTVMYGLICLIGRVLHPPISGVRRSCLETVDQMRPYMDNRYGMRSEPFEVILQPDDGFLCRPY